MLRHSGARRRGDGGRRPTAVLVMAALTATVLTLVDGPASAQAAPTGRAYVSTDAGVAVLDLATNTVVDTIEGVGPLYPTRDGTRAYAQSGSQAIAEIDTFSNTVVATIAVPSPVSGVAVSPDGARVYVGHYDARSVSVIDTATRTVIATIALAYPPGDISVSPNGALVYVLHTFNNRASVIDAATNAVVATVAVGNIPVDVEFSPDGSRAYVLGSGSCAGCPIPSGFAIVDTATSTVVGSIRLGPRSWDAAITPDGTKAYVTNLEQGLFVVDLVRGTYVKTVGVFPSSPLPPRFPAYVAFSPDGSRAYVTPDRGDGRVAVVDTASDTTLLEVPVGAAAGVIVTAPNPEGPHMALSKQATPTSGPAPLRVAYTYALTNDGTHTLSQVGVTDSGCSSPILQSGDANGDQLLNPGETWTFTCSGRFRSAGTYTTTAVARATDTQTGLPVSSNAAATTVTAEVPTTTSSTSSTVASTTTTTTASSSGAPGNLTLTSRTASTAGLRWDPVAGATEYRAYVSRTSGSGYFLWASGLTGTSATLYSLTGDFYVVVRAVVGGVESSNSNEVLAAADGTVQPTTTTTTTTVSSSTTSTTTATPPSGAPTNVALTSRTPSTAGISWNPVAGATEYRAYVSRTSGSGYFLWASGFTGTSATLYSLTGDFYVVVRAVVGGVESPNSNEVLAAAP